MLQEETIEIIVAEEKINLILSFQALKKLSKIESFYRIIFHSFLQGHSKIEDISSGCL